MSEGVEMRIDSDIKRDVEDELQWDPDIDATDIGVAVKSGVVTLTGFVHSYSHKLQAEEDAKRVTGVSGVANDIEVRLPSADVRPDPEIARDVVSELRLQLPFSWEKLKAVVKNGWVTLEGEAEWNYQRERAEQAVRHVKGVIGVSNLIKLKPSVAAADIKRKIEEAFKRNAEIDANRIQVRTSGSEVILEGTVRSWAERQEAERVAWSAPGVAKVEDRIIISP
jgi:osmotically-inducible protein OsmY